MAIKKKIKLLIFFIIFVIAAPIIVLYANGDIFSDGWSLLKTGGIYVNSAPIDAEVYLNNKLKDKVTFFQRDILIKNLKAGNYDILVKKTGYNSWIKKIKVEDNLVTDANVFILPEKPELREITKYISEEDNFGTSTVKTKVKNPEYSEILALFSSTSTLFLKTKISTSSIDFKSNLGTKKSPIMNNKLGLWKVNNKIFAEWFGKNESAPKYMCEETSDCLKSKMVFELAKEPNKIAFLPDYDGVILLSTEGMIFAVQIEENPSKTIQLLYRGKNPDFRLNGGYIYVKEGTSLYEILL